MSSAARPLHLATAADLRALGEKRRFHEVIGGELVPKANPSGEHGAAQAAVAGSLFGPFNRGPGGRWPGGWWFQAEVEVELETPRCIGRRLWVAPRPRAATSHRTP